jgi:hypothetical protein
LKIKKEIFEPGVKKFEVEVCWLTALLVLVG